MNILNSWSIGFLRYIIDKERFQIHATINSFPAISAEILNKLHDLRSGRCLAEERRGERLTVRVFVKVYRYYLNFLKLYEEKDTNASEYVSNYFLYKDTAAHG